MREKYLKFFKISGYMFLILTYTYPLLIYLKPINEHEHNMILCILFLWFFLCLLNNIIVFIIYTNIKRSIYADFFALSIYESILILALYINSIIMCSLAYKEIIKI